MAQRLLHSQTTNARLGLRIAVPPMSASAEKRQFFRNHEGVWMSSTTLKFLLISPNHVMCSGSHYKIPENSVRCRKRDVSYLVKAHFEIKSLRLFVHSTIIAFQKYQFSNNILQKMFCKRYINFIYQLICINFRYFLRIRIKLYKIISLNRLLESNI